jgi:hypothetical protein
MPRATPAPYLAFEITHTHLSRFLRINGMRLSDLTAKGIIRRGTDELGQPLSDTYRFDVALGDYIEYLTRLSRGSGEAIETEKAKMLAVKRRIAELRLAAMNGQYGARGSGAGFRGCLYADSEQVSECAFSAGPERLSFRLDRRGAHQSDMPVEHCSSRHALTRCSAL